MDPYENVKNQLACCGLWCGGCSLGNGEFAGAAAEVAGYIDKYKLSEWVGFLPGGGDVDVPAIVKGLEFLKEQAGCPGCAQGGGPPQCPIRSCAKQRSLDSCSGCAELDACGNFDWLLEGVPDLKDELRTVKAKGVEAYLAEKMESKQ